jgi:hypothetical protein
MSTAIVVALIVVPAIFLAIAGREKIELRKAYRRVRVRSDR